MLSVLVFILLGAMLWVQKMPSIYYAYITFPIFFWNRAIHNKSTLIIGLRLAANAGITKFVFTCAAVIVVLEALVSTICGFYVYLHSHLWLSIIGL